MCGPSVGEVPTHPLSSCLWCIRVGAGNSPIGGDNFCTLVNAFRDPDRSGHAELTVDVKTTIKNDLQLNDLRLQIFDHCCVGKLAR